MMLPEYVALQTLLCQSTLITSASRGEKQSDANSISEALLSEPRARHALPRQVRGREAPRRGVRRPPPPPPPGGEGAGAGGFAGPPGGAAQSQRCVGV